MAENKPSTKLQNEIQYQGDLAGALDATANREQSGLPYSPIQTMWQVNPGAEALPRDGSERPNQNE